MICAARSVCCWLCSRTRRRHRCSFELRNLDVVLLVAVSGMAFSISRTPKRFSPYASARFKRLILPVWLFLTVLFAAIWLTGFGDHFVTQSMIINSYLMIGGIGYVWIMRVFMTVALAAPLLYRLSRSIRSDLHFYTTVTAAIMVYCLFVALTAQPGSASEEGNHSLVGVVYQMIGFSLVFLYGMRLGCLPIMRLLASAAFWFGMIAVVAALYFAAHDVLIETQAYKFPPQLPYLAFGLFMTSVCALVARYAVGHALPTGKAWQAITFVSFNSVWIYLWHIPVVLLQRKLHFGDNFLIVYLCALTFAIGVTAIQRTIVGRSCPRAGSVARVDAGHASC